MGLRQKWASFKEDFSEGFDKDEQLDMSKWSNQMLGTLSLACRAALFGFLVALPGLPFLPWGKPLAITLTLLAAISSALPIPREARPQLIRLAAVLALLTITLRLGSPPTNSALLAGAVLSATASLAASYPFMYGVVFGMSVGALALRVTHFEFPSHKRQLVLSRAPFTTGRFSADLLRLAGFMFLTGVMHLGRVETERFRSKARAAEEARDLAVVDERARIARELHDVVSHHVTAMTLQAEAASMTGDRDALASVATAGRDALTELRRMLGVLRRPSDDAEDPTLEPQPGLAELDRLAERTTAGLRVHLDKQGDVRDLPAGVELCIYRLVQEALTNATKHGDATDVAVVLSYGPEMVTVEIRDNGRALVAPRVRSAGLGLIGMRERVSLLDGELDAGPGDGGVGFAVVARLPVES